jgi:hypothetical protein
MAGDPRHNEIGVVPRHHRRDHEGGLDPGSEDLASYEAIGILLAFGAGFSAFATFMEFAPA